MVFHNSFEDACQHDVSKYGKSGSYLKREYNNPSLNQIILVNGLSYLVTFSGDYTIDYKLLDFAEARQYDIGKYGTSGSYWKKAYGNPRVNQIINIKGLPYIVTFSGDYTIDYEELEPLDFVEASQYDTDKYGLSGPYWKKAYGNPKLGQIIIVDSHQYIVTFSGDYTLDYEEREPVDFMEACQYDKDKYGMSGPYWKKVYGFPEKNQMLIIDGMQCVVTFSGDYTIDYEELQPDDNWN